MHMSLSCSRLMAGLGRVGLVVALMAALLATSPSPAGAVAGYGDVHEGTWYTDPLQWAADNGITGVSGPCFGPDAPVSRGETAVWIYTMEGKPDPADSHPFNDVTDASQNDAVSWMGSKGITTGTSPTTFAPDETLTRGQAAALLHRLAEEPSAPPHSFSDVVAPWQQAGVSWMVHTGVTTGTTPATFAPDTTLTRAHLVTFLYRYRGEPDVTVDPAAPRCDPTTDQAELLTVPEPVEPLESAALDVLDGSVELFDNRFSGAHEWTFANGARVMFVRSAVAENQVNLQAVSQGGWSAGEPGDRILSGRLAIRAVSQSGLGDLSPAQLSRYLDGINASAQPFISETAQGVTGAAGTADVETMFQLMHLLFTAPRVDDQAFAEAVNTGEILLNLSEVDPGWKAWVAYHRARYGDQFDWFNPVASQETLDALTAESLLERYKQRFAAVDDLVVVVVGDVDRDTVERMAQTYVGTLPAGEPDTYVNRRPPAPAQAVRQEVELGPDSQATDLELRHEVLIGIDPDVEVALNVLDVILDARLINDVREDIGATYSVSVSLSSSFTPEPRILSTLSASGAPERMDQIETEIFRILADVTDGNVGADEFDGAVEVVRSNYSKPANPGLIRPLALRAYVPDDQLPTPARLLAGLQQLEREDVLKLAAAIYDPDRYISIVKVLAPTDGGGR